jgi:tetratricopeptide (TPR) repeat protein
MKNFLQIFTCATALLVTGAASAQKPKEDEKAHKTKIEKIAGEACDCTEKIDTNIPRDTIVEKINTCIEGSVMADQMLAIDVDNLTGTEEGVEVDTVSQSVNITINPRKDFDEIQSFLFQNCPNIKRLLASNDVESDKSMSKNPKALKYYDEAQDYETDGEYEKAIELYKKAIKEDKNFAFAWDNIGLCYRKSNNYTEAIKCYEQSLKIDPAGAMPRQNIAIAYEYLKDYKKAAAAYEAVIKHDPKNPEGYYGAGRAFYFDENFEKGVDYMFKAYKMYSEANSPYIEDAQNMLGAMYDDLEKKGKIAIFETAAKNNGVEIR